MKDVISKLSSGESVKRSDIEYSSTVVENRRLRKLDKDHLQIEQEENDVLLAKNIYQDVECNLWKCRNCSWKGPYRHKAKSHARRCGQRQRIFRRKSNKKKYECSSEGCSLSFNLHSELLKHYR